MLHGHPRGVDLGDDKFVATSDGEEIKLAHHLCNGAGMIFMIFVEDINFVSWQRGMLSKHSADVGFGQFVNILEWVCFRRDVYFAKVNDLSIWETPCV